jgi:hypothetical protein
MKRGEKIIARGPVVFGETKFKKGKITKKNLNDLELAKANLANEFKAYPDIQMETRYALIEEMSNYEQFKHMNMKTLASVLAYLNRFNVRSLDDFSPDIFTNNYLKPYFEILDVNKDNKIKYKETFLRYILAILLFRKEN